MLLLKKKSFEIEASAPVVSEEEAREVASAEAIVDAAEHEAEAIRAAAAKTYEAEKKRGYADGVLQAKMDMLDRKLTLVQEATDYVSSIEATLGELVVKALRKCVGSLGSEDLVMPIVRKALEAIVRAQREVTIRVAPALVPVIKAKLAELLKDFPTVTLAEVVEDAHLVGAASVVETAAGNVESSVEGQLTAIEKSIRRQFSKDGH